MLRNVTAELASELGFTPTEADLNALCDSVTNWPSFPDTVEALARLKRYYRIVVISNVDDSLFEQTAKRLYVSFDEVTTAEQVGSYKPGHRNFEFVLHRIGVPAEQVLHKALSFTTVWVNRTSRLPGTGLTLPAEVVPDLEVPDL